jgi:hypothetical protein
VKFYTNHGRCHDQGILGDHSDDEWDEAVLQRYGRRYQEQVVEEAVEMYADVNVVEAVQHAFHLYDDMSPATDPVDDTGVHATTKFEDGDEQLRAGGPSSADEVDGDLERELPPSPTHRAPTTSHEVLEDSARTPLFAGTQLSCLSLTLLILNCLRVYGASNALISELLLLLSKSVLPSINCLPSSEYLASKMLSQLGLSYNIIRACPDGCMLLRGVGSEHIMKCTKYQKPRFKRVGKSLVPAKVLRYFPLIPRMTRMFSTPAMAALMVWHRLGRSTDGRICHVVDSLQWKWVDKHLGEFGTEDRHIRLGMATDGVNPYGVKRSNWNTWLVCLLNYNVPSYLTMKKHFIMLSMIIPRKESMTCETFDVYIQPLIEELHELWETGVWMNDAASYMGSSWFKLRAILLWTIHDFPTYGIVAGCVTKGYKSYPICGPGTISRRSAALKKNLNDNQHRRWLPAEHPWRESLGFDGKEESREPPIRVTGEDVLRWGAVREAWKEDGGSPLNADPARQYGIKKVSGLYQLWYWRVHPIPLLSCERLNSVYILEVAIYVRVESLQCSSPVF